MEDLRARGPDHRNAWETAVTKPVREGPAAPEPRRGGTPLLWRWAVVATALAGVLRPILPDGLRVASGLHTGIEVAGSAIAVSVFASLGVAAGGLRDPWRGLPALAFLAMGILDGAHGLLPARSSAMGLHMASTLVGGALFAALALPEPMRRRATSPWAVAGVAVGSLAFASWTLVARPALGELATADDAVLARALALVGGAGFLVGAWALARGGHRDAPWLVAIAVPFAASAVWFSPAPAWSAEWWVFHVVRHGGFVAGLGLSVTSTRAWVAALERARRDLATANEDLARTVARLERSNAELSQYAHVASHDLREPLRMIRSYLGLLETDHGEAIGPTGREYLAFALDGAERLDRLTRDLLELSRVGTDDAPEAWVDLDAVLARVLRRLRPAIDEAKARVHVGPLPTVPADETQMERLFQNLLANAIKFRGETPPKVEVAAEATPDGYRIAVEDDGIGIDPRYHEKIFEIFQRLHARDAYEGTGVGLAVCRRIVARHRGTISVESEVGRGTTFRIELPAPTGKRLP